MAAEKQNTITPWVGKLVWVDTPRSGKNKNGNEWKSVDFTISYTNDQGVSFYATFNAFGEQKVDKILATPLWSTVKLMWRPNAHEYNNRWYPKLEVYDYAVLQYPDAPELEKPTSSDTSSDKLDLPF